MKFKVGDIIQCGEGLVPRAGMVVEIMRINEEQKQYWCLVHEIASNNPRTPYHVGSKFNFYVGSSMEAHSFVIEAEFIEAGVFIQPEAHFEDLFND